MHPQKYELKIDPSIIGTSNRLSNICILVYKATAKPKIPTAPKKPAAITPVGAAAPELVLDFADVEAVDEATFETDEELVVDGALVVVEPVLFV